MAGDPLRARTVRPWLVLAAGGLAGLLLLLVAFLETGPRPPNRLALGINGVPPRLARDLLLPLHGWTLQVAFDPPLDATAAPELVVELREERTGMTIEIQDQLAAGDGFSTFVVPESMGLREGLLAVRARATFAEGGVAEAWQRLRIRAFQGGPPIGDRSIVHFDFEVDRDGDGRADFERDLEQLGLASPERPELAKRIAERIARRALARVERAYADPADPNRTGLPRDPVAVRFVLAPVELESERPFTTRICVGGRDPSAPGSVGHVRYDPANERRASSECTGEEAAGLFPAELEIYRESDLFRAVFAPFTKASGGRPFGHDPADASPAAPRREELERAIAVLGDVLGTLMAHEAGHALGLVAPGRPAVGLFGGEEGEAFAHAVELDGEPATSLSLMSPGRRFRFEDLAGMGESGELRFRPLDYAYLRDRVVLKERARVEIAPLD